MILDLPVREDMSVEFKTSFSDEVIIALVAFANAKGGSVYVGIKDDGKVVGVDLGKETIAKWLNEIKVKTEPSVIPDANVVETDGKRLWCSVFRNTR